MCGYSGHHSCMLEDASCILLKSSLLVSIENVHLVFSRSRCLKQFKPERKSNTGSQKRTLSYRLKAAQCRGTKLSKSAELHQNLVSFGSLVKTTQPWQMELRPLCYYFQYVSQLIFWQFGTLSYVQSVFTRLCLMEKKDLLFAFRKTSVVFLHKGITVYKFLF